MQNAAELAHLELTKHRAVAAAFPPLSMNTRQFSCEQLSTISSQTTKFCMAEEMQ